MKTHLILFNLFIGFLISISGIAQDNSPKWNTDPRTLITLNPEGVYRQLPSGDNANFSNEIRYYKTPDGVFSVGPNFRVNPRTAQHQSETPIVRHPLNPNILFASANTWNMGGFTSISTGSYRTTDGGVTWTGSDTSVFNYGDPGPMIDYLGRFLISYITSSGSMGAAYSTNNGLTWSTTVTFPGATTSADKNLSATDDDPTSAFYGRSYTVYTEFSGTYVNRIVISYTTNQGVSWSTIAPVSPAPSTGHHHQGCDIRVGPAGKVYVCWANCTTNGQNSTEDSLGFAWSTNGGVNWGLATNHAVNTNGIRAQSLFNSIRVNGFPRIDVDRTCGTYAGRVYVVMAEKSFAPALDAADIVLMWSSNSGTTWTRVKVNQNINTSFEYFPAVRVDESGAVDICYYSTRNSSANDSAQVYLSRSVNGGSSFTDVLISDHKFKPVPISGLATGYQGDYIGITSGGAGKIFPYWCEQNTSTGARYQAYASLVDITVNYPCETFSCALVTGAIGFTTLNLYEEFSGTNYWGRYTASAYGNGTGSARFNSWSAPAGTSQSLITYNMNPIGFYTCLTFDEAYRPWTGGNVDSLIIETSTNGGTTYTALAKLWGGLGTSAGPLNTVSTGGGQFTPIGNQWRPKIYILPASTNKIKFRGRSGLGNDIWVDNICVKIITGSVLNSVGLASQGMYIPVSPWWAFLDTVKVYLHMADFPDIAVDSSVGVVGFNAVIDNLLFENALDGMYYKVVRHRNSIETWQAVPMPYVRGENSHWNFIEPEGMAYGNNQAIVCMSPLWRGMYSGDCNQDSVIDGSDLNLIDNAASEFLQGYVVTDLTGDFFVDGMDYSIADNNAAEFVVRVAPPEGEPLYTEPAENLEKLLSQENNPVLREKLKITIQIMKDNSNAVSEKKRLSYQEFHKMKNPEWYNKHRYTRSGRNENINRNTNE